MLCTGIAVVSKACDDESRVRKLLDSTSIVVAADIVLECPVDGAIRIGLHYIDAVITHTTIRFPNRDEPAVDRLLDRSLAVIGSRASVMVLELCVRGRASDQKQEEGTGDCRHEPHWNLWQVILIVVSL